VSCDAPADPTTASLCVRLLPENITFVPDDPTLDGKGIVLLAAYDTPTPEVDGLPDVPALAQAIYPSQAGGPDQAELATVPTLRLDGLPGKVYVRAYFFDNLDALQAKKVSWGVWVGGVDLAGGFGENLPLEAVDTPAGSSGQLDLPIVALRKLSVSISVAPAATPLDDAQGPLEWVMFKAQAPGMNEPIFGIGGPECHDLSGGKAHVLDGVFVGEGTAFLAGSLDDFNLGNSQAGSVVAADFSSGAFTLPAGSKITVPPGAYRHEAALELNVVVPVVGPAPPSYACP
jgi:hypothetical protein